MTSFYMDRSDVGAVGKLAHFYRIGVLYGDSHSGKTTLIKDIVSNASVPSFYVAGLDNPAPLQFYQA